MKAFLASVETLEEWMESVDTAPELQYCIVEYLRGRSAVAMLDIAREISVTRLDRLGKSHDEIGWTRFLEGMVSNHGIHTSANFVHR